MGPVMKQNSKIVILTGAGISAESGLGTFRDEDGLWTRYALEDVATPEGFARNPQLVLDFYNARRANSMDASPNAAHIALCRLQKRYAGEVIIITQNVDNLHEAAGSEVLHMHGALTGAMCSTCAHRWTAPRVMASTDLCPSCGAAANRPDVVWFGEIPYFMETIADHLKTCVLFAAIGTSGQVYPAAEFVLDATTSGARTVELNLERSTFSQSFDAHIVGPASETVPLWVESLLV